jgi:hypothetical protein
MIQKMTSMRQDQYSQVIEEAEKQSREKGKRVSEAEVIRQAIDFYFSNKDR